MGSGTDLSFIDVLACIRGRYYLYRRRSLYCIDDHGRHYGRLKKFDDANAMGVTWSSIPYRNLGMEMIFNLSKRMLSIM